MFIVVRFSDNNEVSVIREDWIIGDRFVRWPTTLSKGQLEEALLLGQELPRDCIQRGMVCLMRTGKKTI